VSSRDLAKLINASHSVREFAESACRLALKELQIPNCQLILYEAEFDRIRIPYCHGKQQELNSNLVSRLNSPLKHVIQKGVSLFLDRDEYLANCDDPSAVPDIPSAWMALPLHEGDELFAVLTFFAMDASQRAALLTSREGIEKHAERLTPYLITKIRMDQLTETEEKFRRFIETSLDITFQITKEGKVDYVSPNIQTRFGINPHKLYGRHVSTLVTGDQVARTEKALRIILEGKSLTSMQIEIQRSAGNVIPMEVSAGPLFDGEKVRGVQGSIRDISERNKAQQEIERLAFFPLANPMPVVEVDLQGVPSYINPAGIQLLDRMDLDVSQVSQILPKAFKTDIQAALSSQGNLPSREVSLDGLHLLWTAFFLQNQNLIHYYATDITNLKNTEADLIAAKERALQNEEVKTLFLANMSHEIRTPLNSILGFTELIEEEIKDRKNENLETYFETIYMSGKRLWQTVHHILDISQIETGTFELRQQKIDLGQIIRDLGASFQSAARAKGLNLQLELGSDDMHIISDEYCATQAITNLIDNAIKYTHVGHVKLSTAVIDGAVKITIEDTGIGMSKEYQEQMFNLFSQESTGYTKNFQGMGLGLALAHRYLTLIKGRIQFETEQEKGSKFIIYLPGTPDQNLSVEPEPSTKAAAPTASTETNKEDRLSILVVEDDPNSQKLASFTLAKDYDLHFAESVADSKRQLDQHDIQLILLDLSLRGDEDGLDLARFLRADKKWDTVPIIALTAHAFTSDRERCMDAGCNDFMTKPFRLGVLKETIHKLI